MIAAVILAAGTSSRLGRPKQLLQLGDRTVIEHVVDRTLSSSVDRVVVVLGHEADAIRKVLENRDVDVVFNESYLDGQSTSLNSGVRHAIGLGDCEAIVMVLVDQPSSTTAVIDRVITAWRNSTSPIAIALYGNHRSHPAIFDRDVFPELLEVTGDQGARGVLRKYGDQVLEVDSGLIDLPPDIDTEEAYRDMVTKWHIYELNAP